MFNTFFTTNLLSRVVKGLMSSMQSIEKLYDNYEGSSLVGLETDTVKPISQLNQINEKITKKCFSIYSRRNKIAQTVFCQISPLIWLRNLVKPLDRKETGCID